jgi:hypothetical protein
MGGTSSMANVETVIRRHVAALDSEDVVGIGNLFSPDGARIAFDREQRGRDNVRNVYKMFWSVFTPHKLTVKRIVSCGDTTGVLEFSESLTHSKTLPTPEGEIPASHRSMVIHGVAIYELEGETIKELRVYSDALYKALVQSKQPTTGS